MTIRFDSQPVAAPIDLSSDQFTFTVGGEKHTVQAQRNTALANASSVIDVSLANSTIAPAEALKQSPFLSVSIDVSAEGALPYNKDLRVRALESASIVVPTDCVTAGDDKIVSCTKTFQTTLPRAAIYAVGDDHQAKFDNAPVEFSAGTKLGTLIG